MCLKLLVYQPVQPVQPVLLSKVLEMVLQSLIVVFQFDINVKQVFWSIDSGSVKGFPMNGRYFNPNECFGYRQFELPCATSQTGEIRKIWTSLIWKLYPLDILIKERFQTTITKSKLISRFHEEIEHYQNFSNWKLFCRLVVCNFWFNGGLNTASCSGEGNICRHQYPNG